MSLSQWEEEAIANGFHAIAGIDEAGRGPLAGPVVAACCLFKEPPSLEGISDSKKLSAQDRERILEAMSNDPNIVFSYATADVEEIDRYNILQATFLAMGRSVDNMMIPPDFLLVDGSLSPKFKIPAKAIVKGDQKCKPISAASIVAKCHRDMLMKQYHEKWPQYRFDENKGYGTAKHLKALEEHGPCPIHRKSFAPVAKFFAKGAKTVQKFLFFILFGLLR